MNYASLSLDLDNEWSYLKTHGDARWESYPSYLDTVVPRAIDVLRRLGLRITFFIVGQDAALERNGEALRAIATAGHEIGNHSFHHEPWLHTYSRDDVASEIDRAHAAISSATGVEPRGFRGPGYSLSADVLEVLAERGYAYDASTFPTYIGPLARAYYFMTANLEPEERERRKALFGGLADGLRPLTPYTWKLANRTLVEIPVTTFPLAKVPIHFSYLLYIASLAPGLAIPYFRAALAACKLANVAPSLLLHPLDFLGGDDVTTLGFFPGMNLRSQRKLRVLEAALEALAGSFEVVTVGEHAARVTTTRALVPPPRKTLTKPPRTQPPEVRGTGRPRTSV